MMEQTAIKGDNPPPRYGAEDEEAASPDEQQELNGSNGQQRSGPTKMSIVHRVRVANREAKTPVEGTKNVATVICDAFGDIINLALHNVIAIAMIVVGSIYFDKETYCHAANIGLLLVIGGVLTLVRGLVELVIKWRSSQFDESNPRDTLQKSLRALSGLLAVVALVWTITAWIIVFPLKSKVKYEDTSSGEYCDKTLYLFTFWILLLPFIIIGFMLAMVCFIGCCVLILAAVAGSDD